MHIRRLSAWLAAAWLALGASAALAQPFRVLVVMSYEENNPWVREIADGIEAVLKPHAEITYFYMDTKVDPAGARRKGEHGRPLRRLAAAGTGLTSAQALGVELCPRCWPGQAGPEELGA